MEFSHLAILLTENCNAHCKMCCDSRGIVRGKTLTERELDKIINHKTHIKRTNNTLYKCSYECKRRDSIVQAIQA